MTDWILKAKLYQIPQDDFVRFEGASAVATKQDAAQILFSFLFSFLENIYKEQKKNKQRNNLVYSGQGAESNFFLL